MRSIGFYENEQGDIFEVMQRKAVVKHTPHTGPQIELSEYADDFVTRCGIDLNPLDSELKSFEMIQRDGILTKAG